MPTTQKVSPTDSPPSPTPKFSPRIPASWLLSRNPCSFFFFSFLADKNSPFYYGESLCPALFTPAPCTPAPSLIPILGQGSSPGFREGLRGVTLGEDRGAEQ